MIIIIIILISFQATVPELYDSEEDEGGIQTMCVCAWVGIRTHQQHVSMLTRLWSKLDYYSQQLFQRHFSVEEIPCWLTKARCRCQLFLTPGPFNYPPASWNSEKNNTATTAFFSHVHLTNFKPLHVTFLKTVISTTPPFQGDVSCVSQRSAECILSPRPLFNISAMHEERFEGDKWRPRRSRISVGAGRLIFQVCLTSQRQQWLAACL